MRRSTLTLIMLGGCVVCIARIIMFDITSAAYAQILVYVAGVAILARYVERAYNVEYVSGSHVVRALQLGADDE